MNNDDLRRFCIYCATDCIDFPHMQPDHRDDCPQKTGLYPVEKRDIGSHGFVCIDCGDEFKVGDFYVERRLDEHVVECLCVGCGALSAVANGG